MKALSWTGAIIFAFTFNWFIRSSQFKEMIYDNTSSAFIN